MTFGMTVLIILVVLLAVLVAAFLYRLVILRRGGTAALLRVLPSPGTAGGGTESFATAKARAYSSNFLLSGPVRIHVSTVKASRSRAVALLGYRIRHHE